MSNKITQFGDFITTAIVVTISSTIAIDKINFRSYYVFVNSHRVKSWKKIIKQCCYGHDLEDC